MLASIIFAPFFGEIFPAEIISGKAFFLILTWIKYAGSGDK